MSKEFVAVVTGAMRKAAETATVHAMFRGQPVYLSPQNASEWERAISAVLTHPDFQRQVRAYAAAVARGCVPDLEIALTHGGEEESKAAFFNACRAETLANIERWERGEAAPTNQECGNGSITEDTK